MAFPTAVNDQITDSVTQANTKVLANAPAMAMGTLYVATAQALSNAAHNATNAQQQTFVTAQAATTMGVSTLYSLDTATTGVGTSRLAQPAQTAPAETNPPTSVDPFAALDKFAPGKTDGVPAEIVALQLAFAVSLAMHNAVLQQQQTQIALQAAQTMALAMLIARDPGAALEQITQTITANEAQSIATMKALSTMTAQGNGSAKA